VTLDAGDLAPFQKLNSQGELQVETLTRAMAWMRYDGVTLGDHDLATGPDFVKKMVGWLGRPVIASNYALPDSESVRARSMTVRGKRVGILGFLDPELARSAAPWVKASPWEDEKALVDSLRQASDVLVALAHAPDTASVNRLARLYPGLDLIISAHEGKLGDQLYRVGRTAVMGNSSEGRYLGRVEVAFDSTGAVKSVNGVYMPVVKGWGRRAAVDSLLTDYYARMRDLTMSDAFQKERLADLEEPPVEYVGSEACASCHASETAQWKTTRHAHAKETLAKAGSEHDPECQSCHTVGFGFRTGFATPEATPDRWNVGCESCHGPGAAHVASPSADYGEVDKRTCVGCHTPHHSPKFNYFTYRPKIVHGTEGKTDGK
jgi:hypothetical protein